MFFRNYIIASMAVSAMAFPKAPTPATPAAPAAPPAPPANAADSYRYTPELAAFYSAVSQEIAKLKSSPAYQSGQASCDMSQAQKNFPSSPTALPAAPAGSTLKHVLLGTGFQNYTCPTTLNASAVPSAIGAFARLFNVSCIAASQPDIFNTLPPLAYQYPLAQSYFPAAGTVAVAAAEDPDPTFSWQPLNVLYAGLHSFYNLTTPRFDLNVASPGIANGLVLSKKVANSTAWPNATQGAYGAVPYLFLSTIDGTTNGYTSVYRMQTQGGAAPKTCVNNTGEFGVPYTASYWIYGQ